MPDSKSNPRLDATRTPVDTKDGRDGDDDAPPSDSRPAPYVARAHAANDDPSAREMDAPPSSAGGGASRKGTVLAMTNAPAHEDRAPASPEAAPSNADEARLTREELRDFLGSRAAQGRIVQVVRANVPPKTPKHVVDEIAQRASLKALSARLPPRRTRELAWLSTIARNEVPEYYRQEEVREKWVNRDADVEEQPPEPEDDDDAAEEAPFAADAARDARAPAPVWMIEPWLEKRVGDNARDRQTLEMIRDKARGEKTNAQLATDYGISEAAFNNRLYKFKRKYAPLREAFVKREREKRRALLLLLLAGAIVALVALVKQLLWPQRPAVPHDPSVAPRRASPAPSTTPPGPTGTFDQALPPSPPEPLRTPPAPQDQKPPSDRKN